MKQLLLIICLGLAGCVTHQFDIVPTHRSPQQIIPVNPYAPTFNNSRVITSSPLRTPADISHEVFITGDMALIEMNGVMR